MQKLITLVAALVAVAVLAPVAALADDASTINADIAQLQSDVKVKHDTVIADAAALQQDAQSLVGSDKAAAKAKIKADIKKLSTDWHSLVAVCLADRAKLQSDFAAAAATGGAKSELRPLIKVANLQIKASNLEMRAAVAKARAAVVTLRQSYRHHGKSAPALETPPAVAPAAAPVTTP
jgi:hypothetical protein